MTTLPEWMPEVPDWVPPEAVTVGLRWLHVFHSAHGSLTAEPEKESRIVRLLTDERMRDLWRRLCKRTSGQVVAEWFSAILMIVSLEPVAVSPDEIEADWQPLLKTPAQLHQIAELWARFSPPHAGMIHDWARILQHEVDTGVLKQMRLGDDLNRVVVGRKRTDSIVRGFVLSVDRQNRDRLGDPLPDYVAILTSVVLGVTVDAEKARRLTRAKGALARRKATPKSRLQMGRSPR